MLGRHVCLFALSIAVSSAGQAESLFLTCVGSGSATKHTSSQAFATNSDGKSASGTITSTRDVGFEDQVNVEIVDGAGKIRMPRTMLPTIRGGKDGWFEIEKVKVGEKEITGNAAVSFLNSPKVRIDRVTGNISISGKSGSFAATCRPYDPATVQRAF